MKLRNQQIMSSDTFTVYVVSMTGNSTHVVRRGSHRNRDSRSDWLWDLFIYYSINEISYKKRNSFTFHIYSNFQLFQSHYQVESFINVWNFHHTYFFIINTTLETEYSIWLPTPLVVRTLLPLLSPPQAYMYCYV